MSRAFLRTNTDALTEFTCMTIQKYILPYCISPFLDKLTAASEVHGAIHDESLLQLYPYEQNARLAAIEPTESPDILEGPELEALIGRFSGSQPRFFDQFPHERSLLSNIQLRLSQNLPTLRTGSIRPGSSFYRYWESAI